MAVSNEMFGLVVALFLIIYFLYQHKTRWIRIVGSFAIILCGITFGVIQDSSVMLMVAGVCIIIGGVGIFKELPAFTGNV